MHVFYVNIFRRIFEKLCFYIAVRYVFLWHSLYTINLTGSKSIDMVKHKHITEPDMFGYQVRIVRRGKESSRYFSHKLWGNRMKSLQAAITWRDQMLVVLKGSRMRFLKPPKNKTTTGVTGVSRTIKYDNRKDKRYLCYTVFWVKDKKSRNKTFQVGNVETVTADNELHAFRTAKLFRSCYEYAIDHDLKFDDNVFAGWKKTRIYDNTEVNIVE